MTGRRLTDDSLRDGLREIAAWGTPSTVPTLPETPVIDLDVERGRRRLPAWWTAAAVLITMALVLSTLGSSPTPSIADGSWTPMAAAPIPARAAPASVWTGTEMVVVGGQLGNGEYVRDAAAYHPRTNTWRTLPDAPADVLPGATALWTGREVVVLPSATWVTVTMPLNRDYHAPPSPPIALDPGTGSWRTLPRPADPVVAGAVVNGRLFVLTQRQQLTVLFFEGGYWRNVVVPDASSMDAPTSEWAGIAAGNDAIFIARQLNPARLQPDSPVGFVVDTLAQSARPILQPPVLRPPLTEATTFTVTGAVAITATESVVYLSRAVSNDGVSQAGAAVYDTASGSWRRAVHLDTPLGDMFKGLAVTTVGTTVLVTGGIATGVVGEGPGGQHHAYSVDDDRWYPLPHPGIDMHRAGHTAVWTGAELVLWGGVVRTRPSNRGDSPAADGAVYRLPSEASRG